MKVPHAFIGGLATAMLVAVPALADPRHHATPTQKPMTNMMPMKGMMPMMNGMMDQGGMMMPLLGKADHIEGRLAFLKTELKITDAQLTPWNAFADVVRASASQMSDMMKQMSATTGDDTKRSLPDRIAMHETRMAAHLEMLRNIKAVLLPLYATFSDEQKTAADSLLCPINM